MGWRQAAGASSGCENRVRAQKALMPAATTLKATIHAGRALMCPALQLLLAGALPRSKLSLGKRWVRRCEQVHPSP